MCICLSPSLNGFRTYLVSNERAPSTVTKYVRDVDFFLKYADGQLIDQALLLKYKEKLRLDHCPSGANSIIAAINAYMRFSCRPELYIKPFKVQKKIFRKESEELTREEYFRLIHTSRKKNDFRLSLLIETVCSTGIRISELRFITVEAIRCGKAEVDCKGKVRTIFIICALKKKLLKYARSQGITTGHIFRTRSGAPMDRSNIWREMKRLCSDAGVDASKVFPHNLRHLFARTFYSLEKDISKLADVLGHSNINTTRIYLIHTGEEHLKYMERMRLIS